MMMMIIIIIIITSRSVATRRNGTTTTSDVFGKVTPLESYLLLQNSRQTYAADYHDHAAQTDAPLSAH